MTMLETAPTTVTTDIDVQVVKQARDLFRDHPETWTKGTVARDIDGQELAVPYVGEAAQVCAIGALYRFGLPITWLLDSGDDMTWAKYLVGRLACFSSMMYECPSIIQVNDERGREQVIDVFDTYLAWREDHEADEIPPGWDAFTARVVF